MIANIRLAQMQGSALMQRCAQIQPSHSILGQMSWVHHSSSKAHLRASIREPEVHLSASTQRVKFLDVPGRVAEDVADQLMELGAMSAGFVMLQPIIPCMMKCLTPKTACKILCMCHCSTTSRASVGKCELNADVGSTFQG